MCSLSSVCEQVHCVQSTGRTYGQMEERGWREESVLAPVNVTVCVRGEGVRRGGLDVAGCRHKGGLIVNTHSESSGSAAGSAANKPFIKTG